jgi:hypothetical protein
MYGYNCMLKVEGYEGTTKTTYYGLSIGTGIEFKSKRNPASFWSLGLLLPFRDKSFKNVIDDLRLAGYSVKDPLPVGISVGYHFKVK